MPSRPLTPKAAAHLAKMIARAERRGEILEELVEVGRALAKEIAKQMMDGPYHPEPRHDQGRAFAAVSRSVRLTIVLETKVDEQLFALHNGDVPSAPAPRPAVLETALDRRRPAGSCSEDEAPDFDRRESETECLVEYDRHDLSDFRASVEAIRADLGLQPDPGLWSGEDDPPCVEVGRADPRRPAESQVGDGRAAGVLETLNDDDGPEEHAIPPPGAGL